MLCIGSHHTIKVSAIRERVNHMFLYLIHKVINHTVGYIDNLDCDIEDIL